MAANKTRETNANVTDFLQSVSHDGRRTDSMRILEMMKKITDLKPKMWGGSIIGFGSYHYRYDSGREGNSFRIGFSPRKNYLSLYLFYGFKHHPLMKGLGKYKGGKACLNINKLADVDEEKLYELMKYGFEISGGGKNPYSKLEKC